MSRSIVRAALALAIAGAIAGAGASAAAAASSIGLAPAGAISWVSDGLTRFGLPVNTVMFQCLAQLDGTLASVTPKTPGASLGTITSASFHSCHTNQGAIPVVTTLGSWNIAYRGYTGKLPRRHGHGRASRTGYVEATLEDFQVYDTWLECLRAGDVPLRIRFSGSPMVSGAVEILDTTLEGTGDCLNLDFLLWGEFAFTTPQTLTRVR